MATIDLQDAAAIRTADTQGMLALQIGYPQQFREGIALARAFSLPPLPADLHEVVILGTGGGSAASGQLLRSYLFHEAKVPIQVVQGYNCPGYVDEHSVVIAVSHSGKTEEINSSFEQAARTGATLVAMGAGGRLKETATRLGAPYLDVPGGLMPRVAIGYIFVPILLMLERWGLCGDQSQALAESLDLLAALASEYGPESPVERNLAKQVTREIMDKIPVIYGFADHFDAVAWRWKNQLGENGKYMAFWNTIPHLHHDEAVGWDMQPELLRQLAFVLLRDRAGESAQMQKRWTATREILAERAGACVEVWSRGESLLARMLSLVVLGDFVSCYMAIAKGVDPTPVAIIDLFKKKVGQ
ncbi:MAG: bifunctional phosphoglucose/phosphomannose isomerase [Symbiobacterium sp.]|uniref:bifunctional phosphoglucose/phosphomannose isomerase n=1 Tax=Symbiobacterium sp. TaxID=1971213 RepID=UPI0034648E32